MNKVLVFWLGNELYGLEISHIQEVAEAPTSHYIPKAPEHFLGAINFHGSILPIFALADFLGFGEAERDHRVIVLPPARCSLALAVTGIRGFVPYDPETLLPMEDERKEDTLIRAVLNREEEMINMLDLDTLLRRLEDYLGEIGGKRGA